MILAKVEDAIKISMKGNATHRNFLRLIKGELQMAEVRQNKPLTEEQEANVLKKMLKSNEETLGLLGVRADDARYVALLEENEILKRFLPTIASIEDVKAALVPVLDQIKLAKSDGQATGIAMKTIKEVKLACDGNTVKEIVAELRK